MFRAPIALAPAALFLVGTAHAYTYQSAVSKGCHERIAAAAMRAVTAPRPAPSANDRALIDDLPFDLASDMHDLAGASLTIGVRDNDLKGRGPDELDSLAQVHGNPFTQREHCLRGPNEDEPNGTTAALEDCKAFIREKVVAALSGLDANGVPDPTNTVPIGITLTFRGQVSARLPRFWIEMGQALHAMEDSFTHNYRSADHLRVRVTENYADWVNGNYSEPRDGPAHRSQMDECENLDAYRTRNLELATKASTEMLQLALAPGRTRAEKLADLDGLFGRYLDYEAGCTAQNRWCDAEENRYDVDAGCSIAGRRLAGSLVFAGAVGAVAIALLARRRRVAVAAGALAILCPAAAHADEPTEPAPAQPATPIVAKPESGKPPPATLTVPEVKAEEKNEEHLSRFAIFGAATGSLSNPSVNGQLGFRVNLSEHWQVGVDAELNGWYGSITKRLTAGAFNAYGTVVFRTPLRFAPLNLRSTANLGTATQLVDLYGARSGSTGIFVAWAPIGVEWKLSARVFLVLSGLSLALPITHLSGGAPFAYSQYRESIGLEVAL